MKRYIFRFYGRPVGSIGVCYQIVASEIAEDADTARVQLSGRFEHVSGCIIIQEERVIEREGGNHSENE